MKSIEDRFKQPGYLIYQNLEELITKAANNSDYTTELKEVLSFYSNDFDATKLSTQLEVLSASFTTDEHTSLKDVLTFLRTLSTGQRSLFNQVCKVANIILVMPATNAASERTFSTMKRVKSYLRSTMGQERLNHLMTLNIYKKEVSKLDLNIVANEFVQGSDHRNQVFGKFM